MQFIEKSQNSIIYEWWHSSEKKMLKEKKDTFCHSLSLNVCQWFNQMANVSEIALFEPVSKQSSEFTRFSNSLKCKGRKEEEWEKEKKVKRQMQCQLHQQSIDQL